MGVTGFSRHQHKAVGAGGCDAECDVVAAGHETDIFGDTAIFRA